MSLGVCDECFDKLKSQAESMSNRKGSLTIYVHEPKDAKNLSTTDLDDYAIDDNQDVDYDSLMNQFSRTSTGVRTSARKGKVSKVLKEVSDELDCRVWF